jgi:nucleoside-diphosphate-sugar epimerase
MRVLAIGGTRFIGPAAARRLHTLGHEVTLFHRGKSAAELPKGIKHIRGDRNKLTDFQDTFRKIKPDVVLDMIPITEQHAQHVIATFKGIAARVVAISSQDVYRAYGILIGKEQGLEPTPLNEDSPLRRELYPYRGEQPRADSDPQKILDDYDKIPIEETVMGEPSMPGTVLRLPMVYGPGDYQHRLFEYLKRMDDKRPAIVLDRERAAWRSSNGYVENVAHAIVVAVTSTSACNRIYNVAEPDNPTVVEWVREIGNAAGWKGEIVVVERDQLPDALRSDFNAKQHLAVDTTRIRKELGYSEVVTLHEALARTIEWERKHPPVTVRPEQFDYAAEDAVLQTIKKH